VALLLASAVAVAPVVVAQTAQDTPERLGRCFTPVTHTGVYFLVTADGPTERILRATPKATSHKVRHSMSHSQIDVMATARVRVPAPEPNIDGKLWSRTEPPRVDPPVIDSLQFRDTAKDSVDVVINSAIGSTGCRLRLR